MLKSALAAAQAALAANFVEQNSWQVVADYGDCLQEHQAVRKKVGLIDLCHRGRIEVSGKNRTQFLHGLVSSDVKNLAINNGLPSAFLNVNGRVLADCFIYALSESILIDTAAITREKVYAMLDKFSPAGDFHVTDITESSCLLTLQGPEAGQILATLSTAAINELTELQLMEIEIDGRKLTVIKNSRTGEDGYDLLMTNINALPIFRALLTAGAKAVGLSALNILRLEAGLPEYGIDVDESIILLEAAMERAVSLTKGCFLGQETIAKIHYRGHHQTAKRLSGLISEDTTVPPRAAKIYNKDNKEIGQITSAVYSPSCQHSIALAYLKRDNFAPGLLHTIEVDGKRLQARVKTLPFYDKIQNSQN